MGFFDLFDLFNENKLNTQEKARVCNEIAIALCPEWFNNTNIISISLNLMKLPNENLLNIKKYLEIYNSETSPKDPLFIAIDQPVKLKNRYDFAKGSK